MMYGSLVKTYAEELLGVAPNKICFTSVMPCVRKRGELM
jgi:iron only hydrogenase large subunit-like protein